MQPGFFVKILKIYNKIFIYFIGLCSNVKFAYSEYIHFIKIIRDS